MALDKKSLNSVFSLGKDKKTGQWEVGQWANQNLFSVDGSNKKICKFTEMRFWKYFQEVIEHTSDVPLTIGDRVGVPEKRGVNEWYYVVSSIASQDSGKFKYIIGF